VRWSAGQVRNSVACALAFAFSACASAPREPAPLIEPNGEKLTAVISAPLDRTAEWTTDAFHELGILLKEVELDADSRLYVGTDEKLSVSAALTRESQNQTRIEVTAHNDVDAPETQYAHKVIERIVRQQY